MNELIKKWGLHGFALIFAVATGLQWFGFGNGDIQALKTELAKLSDRLAKLEPPTSHE